MISVCTEYTKKNHKKEIIKHKKGAARRDQHKKKVRKSECRKSLHFIMERKHEGSERSRTLLRGKNNKIIMYEP